MRFFRRAVILVLDGVGVGELPDAARYGDAGTNTLSHVAGSGCLKLPVLGKLGLGNITDLLAVPPAEQPLAWWGKMAEISKGKDTTSGHWELSGVPVFSDFPVYPLGFPAELIRKFVRLTGRNVLGNKAASGTEIIEELGEKHLRTGCPIVYTSADSVFQIAAHEEVIPLEELYRICKITRDKVCIGEHAVGRVIARPFIGMPGAFVRTARRHDYSVPPPARTVLEILKEAGYSVIGVGKISDIFAGRGLTESFPTSSNDEGMEIVTRLVKTSQQSGIIMANLVEFDSNFGHRNDALGLVGALNKFDLQLGVLLGELTNSDLLIITADHGCDPTTPGTDHTREYVPLLVYHPEGKGGTLGVRTSFADVAATIAENFNLVGIDFGESFMRQAGG